MIWSVSTQCVGNFQGRFFWQAIALEAAQGMLLKEDEPGHSLLFCLGVRTVS